MSSSNSLVAELFAGPLYTLEKALLKYTIIKQHAEFETSDYENAKKIKILLRPILFEST